MRRRVDWSSHQSDNGNYNDNDETGTNAKAAPENEKVTRYESKPKGSQVRKIALTHAVGELSPAIAHN